ncbi:MAG: hypothetical protein ACK5AY_01690 [Bacteroidota bacterium]|jgi:hypothetical protein
MIFKQIHKLPAGTDWKKIILAGVLTACITALLIKVQQNISEQNKIQ